MTRLMARDKLNRKLAKQILDSEYLELFESLAGNSNISETVIAVGLTETLKALKRDGIKVDLITDEQFKEMFKLIDSGKTTKESIPDLLTWLADNEDSTVKDALASLGLSMMTRKELEEIVDDVIEKNYEFIEQRGKGAFGALMGIVMKKARGRVKPQIVNEMLKSKIVTE